MVEKSTVYNISLEEEDTFFANNILNHNTPPHIIRPKNGKALHWKSGGKDVFAKVVNHPGTRPNPFIRTTFKQQLIRIVADNADLLGDNTTVEVEV